METNNGRLKFVYRKALQKRMLQIMKCMEYPKLVVVVGVCAR